MDATDDTRLAARLEALRLVEDLLIDDARHRRHSRLELVLRSGVVDHIRYEHMIKIALPSKKVKAA